MKVISTVQDMRDHRSRLTDSVGLVPTMGYLHEGHLSLVRHARGESDCVFVSIFVNPTQFGPNEDLQSYPRDLDRDLDLLEREGVDVVFTPSVEEMYPDGYGVSVEPGPIAKRLEGAARPGHFRGVATVVLKLLNIVRPQAVYFGQKDAQQLLVLKHMVHDLFLPVRIVGCPTVREADGLALSSRNVYLAPEERRAATSIYRALTAARAQWLGGEPSSTALRDTVHGIIEAQPELRLEYVSVAHPGNLQELNAVGKEGALLSVAVRAGKARLIDNIRLVRENSA